MSFSKLRVPFFIILAVLVADQALKLYVKLTMAHNQEFSVIEDFFYIHFLENDGMAFGMELPFFETREGNKMFLSIFRLVAIVAIGWYLFGLIKKGVPNGLKISIALIFAGALGNMIDSAFYGVIFTDSYGRVAEIFPAEGGYSGFFLGRVVDSLSFPMFEGHWPDWVPWTDHNECTFEHCDGRFVFFGPIFNLADMSISTGVGMILAFNKRYFKNEKKEAQELQEAVEETATNDEA